MGKSKAQIAELQAKLLKAQQEAEEAEETEPEEAEPEGKSGEAAKSVLFTDDEMAEVWLAVAEKEGTRPDVVSGLMELKKAEGKEARQEFSTRLNSRYVALRSKVPFPVLKKAEKLGAPKKDVTSIVNLFQNAKVKLEPLYVKPEKSKPE